MRPRQRIGGRREAAGNRDRRRAKMAGRPTSSPRGRDTGTSRGARSCKRSSVASTMGSPVEALADEPTQEHVGQRSHRHALVMRHVGAHHHDARPLGQAGAREVQRLVVAMHAPSPTRASSTKFRAAGGSVHHGGEGGRIRATTRSSPNPRSRPSPGTPKAESTDR